MYELDSYIRVWLLSKETSFKKYVIIVLTFYQFIVMSIAQYKLLLRSVTALKYRLKSLNDSPFCNSVAMTVLSVTL
jgi:hypothetical protein